MDDLDRNGPSQHALLCAVDPTHASDADELEQDVRTSEGAADQRILSGRGKPHRGATPGAEPIVTADRSRTMITTTQGREDSACPGPSTPNPRRRHVDHFIARRVAPWGRCGQRLDDQRRAAADEAWRAVAMAWRVALLSDSLVIGLRSNAERASVRLAWLLVGFPLAVGRSWRSRRR